MVVSLLVVVGGFVEGLVCCVSFVMDCLLCWLLLIVCFCWVAFVVCGVFVVCSLFALCYLWYVVC